MKTGRVTFVRHYSFSYSLWESLGQKSDQSSGSGGRDLDICFNWLDFDNQKQELKEVWLWDKQAFISESGDLNICFVSLDFDFVNQKQGLIDSDFDFVNDSDCETSRLV